MCLAVVTKLSWLLACFQIPGVSAFWPLVVTGAPYYISDYEGRSLTAAGRVCDGITTFECYQTLTDGVYILRLGGGLFGRVTGFPMRNASWQGCDEQGGLHDQLVRYSLHYTVYIGIFYILYEHIVYCSINM